MSSKRHSFEADNFGGKGWGLRAANDYSAWQERYADAKTQGKTEEEAIAIANKKGK